VYALRNTANGRVLVASTLDLSAARSKLEFAKATNSPGALDHHVVADARAYGVDVFTFEVLDLLDPRPGMTDDEMRADLAALGQLWRENLAGDALY
jgi:hypothetical protein